MHAVGITFIIIAVFVLVIALFKLHLKLTTGWDRSPTCLVGKTAIVTGANTGIGFYTAQDFAKRGARVILACRDPIRAEEAKTRIIENTGNPNVLVRIVDFASLSSVRKFAIEIKTTEDRLDILVNNAGSGGLPHTITPDGLSLSMQINYFGPFLLTILLLGLLKESNPSRIVNVSSALASMGKININDLNAFPSGIAPKARDYANSKLCNILFTNHLAQKLKNSGVDANSVHPGAVQTEFFRNLSGVVKSFLTSIARLFYKTTEEGAQSSIYLAVSKDVNGVTGQYCADCKIIKMPKNAGIEGLAKQLWDKSEEFVKLTPEERKLA